MQGSCAERLTRRRGKGPKDGGGWGDKQVGRDRREPPGHETESAWQRKVGKLGQMTREYGELELAGK